MIEAQYPNGAWPQRWHGQPHTTNDFPIAKARYPASYPREFPKVNYYAHYTLNDNAHVDCLDTMLDAFHRTGKREYLDAAKRGGDFLILAQMPEPQPAWAQQYDKDMHPVWGRAFEVTAISSRESESVLEALMMLTRATGDKKWLAPIPKALAYLKKSLRKDGTLARYYELRTNVPLYFQRVKGGGHELTTSDAKPSSNYGFIIARF